MICFTIFVHKESIKMLSLYYHELNGKDQRIWGKKYFKEIISIEKFDDTKILIDTANKLPDEITFIKIVIVLTCVIKEDGKLYLQIFLEKVLVV